MHRLSSQKLHYVDQKVKVINIKGQTSEYDVQVLEVSVGPRKCHSTPKGQGQLLENDGDTSPVTVEVVLIVGRVKVIE